MVTLSFMLLFFKIDNGDFYPGAYPPYGDFYPGQEPGMPFGLPPGGPQGTPPLVDNNGHPAGT